LILIAATSIPMNSFADCERLLDEGLKKADEIERQYSSGGACMVAKSMELIAQIAIDIDKVCIVEYPNEKKFQEDLQSDLNDRAEAQEAKSEMCTEP
jgi:hypothetical protein